MNSLKRQHILNANGCFGILSTRRNCLCPLFSCWMPFLHGDLMVPSRARWLAYPTGWKERSAAVGSCSTIRRVCHHFPRSNRLRFEGVVCSIGIPCLYQYLHQCYSQVPQNATYPQRKGVFPDPWSQMQLPTLILACRDIILAELKWSESEKGQLSITALCQTACPSKE